MTGLLEKLYRHQAVGWIAAGVYLILVALNHDNIQKPILLMNRTYGVVTVHYAILAVILPVCVLMLWRCRVALRDHPSRQRMIVTGIVIGVLGVLVFNSLMLRSVEMIHYLQYWILALMISGLTRSPLLGVLLASLGGVFDESWQFFQLHPRQPYFDFNDTTMNVVGALMGGWTYVLFSPGKPDPARLKAVLAGWGALSCLVIALFIGGVFGVYRGEGDIVLHRRIPPTAEKPVKYVRKAKWGNTWYRLHAYPGTAILLLLPLGGVLLPGVRKTGVTDSDGPGDQESTPTL